MGKIGRFVRTEAFKYLVFGALTTLVYYIFMYGSLLALGRNPYGAAISELVGQVVSITFAFFTNKKWVFEHESSHVLLDFLNFVAGRVVFMLVAIAAKWWFGDVHPELLTGLFRVSYHVMILVLSLILQGLNILLNYFYSKFIVFRKKK